MDTPKLQPITNKLKSNSASASNVTKDGGDAANTSNAGKSSRFSASGSGYGTTDNANDNSNHQFSSGDRRYNYKGPIHRDFLADRRKDQYQNRPEPYRSKYAPHSYQSFNYLPHWAKSKFKSNYRWSSGNTYKPNYWQNETLARNTTPYISNAAERKSMHTQKQDTSNTAANLGIEKKAETTTNQNNIVNAVTTNTTKTGNKKIVNATQKTTGRKSIETANNNTVQQKKPKTSLVKKLAPNTKKINRNKTKISANIGNKKQLTKTHCENINNTLKKTKIKNKIVTKKVSEVIEKSKEQKQSKDNLSNKEKNTTLNNKEQSKNKENCTDEEEINKGEKQSNNKNIEAYAEESPTTESFLGNSDFEETENVDINNIDKDAEEQHQNTIEGEVDTECIIKLSQSTVDDNLEDIDDDPNITNLHTINCVNIANDEEEITILLATDLPDVVDIEPNYSNIFVEREFIEAEEEEIATEHNCSNSSPIKDTNNKPRISIVPLSRLVRNELIETATDDLNISETESPTTSHTIPPLTPTTAITPSKRICRPNLVKRRRKISSCSNSSGTTENLIEKVAGMDKFGIKQVINNSGTRFDEVLKAHARKRLREEIRKQLKSMNLETAKDVDNIDFVPDDIVDAICIPDVVLDEIRKAFGIEFFYNNDLNVLQEAAMTFTAPNTQAASTDTATEASVEDLGATVGAKTITNNARPLQESLVETTTTTIVGTTDKETERQNNEVEKEKTVEKQNEIDNSIKTNATVLGADKTKNFVETDKTLVNKKVAKTSDKTSKPIDVEKSKNNVDKGSAGIEKQGVTKKSDKATEVKGAKNTKSVVEQNKTVKDKNETNRSDKTAKVIDEQNKTVKDKNETNKSEKMAKVNDVDTTKRSVGKRVILGKRTDATKSNNATKVVDEKKTKNLANNKKQANQQQTKESDKSIEVSNVDKTKTIETDNKRGEEQQAKDNEKMAEIVNVDIAETVTEKTYKRWDQLPTTENENIVEIMDVDITKTVVEINTTQAMHEQTNDNDKTHNKPTNTGVTESTRINAEQSIEIINESNDEDNKNSIRAIITEIVRKKRAQHSAENVRKKKTTKRKPSRATKKHKAKWIENDVILLDTSSSSSSSSSTSSDSSTDSDSEASVKSVSSSVKRRRIKLRIDAQNIVESFEKLILPSLSDNLKTRYHNKFSNSTYTRLHFISCICTSEYNTKKFTKNEIAKIQADLKSEDRSAALEFLMREIVNVFNKQKENAKKERSNRIRRNTDSTDKSQQSNDEQSVTTVNATRINENARDTTLVIAETVNGICSETVKDTNSNSCGSGGNRKTASAAENEIAENNCDVQSQLKTTPSCASTPTKEQQQEHQSVNEQTLMRSNNVVVEVDEQTSSAKNANQAKNTTTTDEIIRNEMRQTSVVNAFAEAYDILQQNNNQHNKNSNQITTHRNILANTATSNNTNNTGNMPQRDEMLNAARPQVGGLCSGAETLPRLYAKDRLFSAENKLNGTTTSAGITGDNGAALRSLWGLSAVSPLMISNTLFPNVDLETLRQKNILGEFVVNNLRELDFKLMELHKRKMFVEEMVLKLQKDKMDIDMQTMQLQNEKFLLLNTAMTAAASELPKNETTSATQTPATSATPTRTTTPNSEAAQIQTDRTTSSTNIITNTPPPAETAVQTNSPNLRKRKITQNNSTNTPKRYRPRGKRGGCCRRGGVMRRANNAAQQCKDQKSTADNTFEQPNKRLSSSPSRIRDLQPRTPSPHISSSDRWFNDTDRSFNSDDIPIGTIDVKSTLTQLNLYEHYIIAGGEDGRLYKFNAKTLKLEMQFAKHSEAITHSYLCREKKVLYTTSLDGYMKKTSLENFALDIQSVYMQEPLQCIEVQWGAAFIGSRWGNIFTYDIGSNNPNNTANSASDTPITAIKATKEGPRRVLIVASKSRDLQIRDASSYLLLRTITLPDSLSAYTLLLDDGCIYCGTQRRDIIKLDFITGELICIIASGIGASVVRQYQKKYLLIGSYDGCVYVIDKAKGRQWGRYVNGDGSILTLTVMDNKILTTSKDKTLRITELPHYFETKRK